MRSLPPCAALLLLAACATTGSAPTPTDDGSATGDLGHRDLAPGGNDGPCALGTPDHCGACGTSCPPGMDDVGTQRVCSAPTTAGTCDIHCKGEYYDVDGLADNGCESIDAPVQDSAMTAVMETLQNNAVPLNLLGKLYSDTRVHVSDPTMRPNGRDDWYAVDVIGNGTNVGMQACLSIQSLPADNTFEVCISDIDQTTFMAGSCRMATGQVPNSACVFPPAKTNDSKGLPYYVRVRKMQGTPSLNGYALFMQH